MGWETAGPAPADEAAQVVARAEHLIELGRAVEALALAGPAQARWPDHPGLASVRSAALRLLERPEESVAAATAGLAANPDDPRLLWELVAALCDLDQASAALPHAERLLWLHPDEVSSARAFVLTASAVPSRRRDALAVAERAVQTHPEDPQAHLCAGLARGAVRDRRGARAAYEQALALDPHDSSARTGLSLLRVRRGNVVELVRLLVNEARHDPAGAGRESAELLRGWPFLFFGGGLLLLLPVWLIGWPLSVSVGWGQAAWVVAFAAVAMVAVVGMLALLMGAGRQVAADAVRSVLDDDDVRDLLPWLVIAGLLQVASLVGGWVAMMGVLPVVLAGYAGLVARDDRALAAVVGNGPLAIGAWVWLGWPIGAVAARYVEGGRALWGWTITGQAAALLAIVGTTLVVAGWRAVDTAGRAEAEAELTRAAHQHGPGATRGATTPAFDLGMAVSGILGQLATWLWGWGGLWWLPALLVVVSASCTPLGRRWQRPSGSAPGPRGP